MCPKPKLQFPLKKQHFHIFQPNYPSSDENTDNIQFCYQKLNLCVVQNFSSTKHPGELT